ncbi:hypothetical protein DOTSEDRAFT_128689 [Dothistroma septosporum NZE10]|uniref:O-methyltransferase C-terminal domain-containing protein n=1 Tax=Dothistroma septosporum (strain NZE10 / CBS 128990) TaxID=675120 RepID=N1PR29_DOTSN|nr:hypothetical protein DOTSEDRAFT_128689 [Dothistroma septosporum NZE10]
MSRGSQGDVLIDCLEKTSVQVTEAVVRDIADVVEAGRQRAPAELKDRLRFQTHDFVKLQEETADMYFMQWIFHNWSNKKSVQILRNLIPSTKPGTKIIIGEYLLPDQILFHSWMRTSESLLNVDLTVLALLNAIERDAEGLHDLLHDTDTRIHMNSIKMMPPGVMAVIEVMWKP